MNTILKNALAPSRDGLVRISLEEEMQGLVEGENTRLQALAELEEADRTMDIVEAMEDMAIVADSATEVSPKEAALLQIASDLAVAGTSFTGEVIMPAMEDLDNGTRGLVQNIRNVVAQIIKTIYQIGRNIYAHAMKYFKGIGQSAGNLMDRVEAAQKRFEDFEGRVDGSVKVRMPAVASGSNLGHFATPGEYLMGLESLLSLVDRVKYIDRAFAQPLSVRALNALTEDKASFQPLKFDAGQLQDVEDQDLPDDVSGIVDAKEGNTRVTFGGVFASVGWVDKQISAAGDAPNDAARIVRAAVTSSYVKIHSSPGGEMVEMPALNSREITQALKLLKIIVAHFDKGNSSGLVALGEVAAAHALKVSETFSAVIKKHYASGELDSVARAEAGQRLSKHLVAQLTTPYTTMGAELLRAANTTLRYVKGSLDAYDSAYGTKKVVPQAVKA